MHCGKTIVGQQQLRLKHANRGLLDVGVYGTSIEKLTMHFLPVVKLEMTSGFQALVKGHVTPTQIEPHAEITKR